jgi:RalA-binding protein 1
VASHTRQTANSPYVSPTTTSNTPLRNNPPAGTQQAVLSNTLIPRDYLATLSKSRLNAADSSVRDQPASPSTISSSGVSSQATARALSRGQSSDDEEYEDETVNDDPDDTPPVVDLKVGKTRTNVLTSNQTHSLQKTIPRVASPQSTTSSTTPDPLGAMPRTSSIDSAISTISTSSLAPKAASEHREPSATDIRNLIATAGSAENLVQHLLRDKAHAASQNAQLWKLVDKQRALLLGLNKDLERVTKERDRYRKRAKDLQGLALNENISNHAAHSQTPPTSAGDEPRSQLPLAPSPAVQTNAESATPSHDQQQQQHSQTNTVRSPVESAMMPSPLHLQLHQVQTGLASDPFMVPQMSPTLGIDPPPTRLEANSAQPPPKLTALTTSLAAPAFSVTEATPLAESPARAFPAQKKKAPKPLNLTQTKEEQRTTSLADDQEAESLERGRRKTREEDDRERETAVLEEQEARSRSKKEKRSKVDQSRGETLPKSPNEPTSQHQTTSLSPPPASSNPLLGLSPPPGDLLSRTLSGGEQRLLSPPLRSPGLPASPRPLDRSLASPLPGLLGQGAPTLPMSPRNGGFPLSPRAPKQPLPVPTNLHSTDTLSHRLAESSSLPPTDSAAETDRLHAPEPTMGSNDVPTVYRGLVSPTWPDLLLPPNALPSIQVKVASSRLRPSRFSMLGFRPQEDSSVFSLSVFSRSNSGELWRLEKIPGALSQLDQILRPRCPSLPRLPDRKLFTGHAPATLDTRRTAIDSYFEDLLDTHVDEQSALMICKFLSTDVLEPTTENRQRTGQVAQIPSQPDPTGKPRKTGYLTKKGKNFGGWKSRYFVLDSPELRYFESPGGAHLGTIKLLAAKIGRQTSDSVNEDGETDGQFRHAFLVLEPKRKDSNSYVRHVLCAENDAERDDWVRTLMHYIDDSTAQDSRPTTSGAQSSDTSGMTGNPRSLLRGTDFADSQAESTMKLSSPTLGPWISGGNSPISTSPATPDGSAHDGYWPKPTYAPGSNAFANQRGPPKQTQPFAQPPKEQKIRNLFQFRKSSHEQLNTSQSSDDRAKHETGHKNRGYVRPVFGLSLAEAVEMCPPRDVDVLLPAVVYRSIEYLRHKKAANEEGLFRLSGSNLVIRTLKERFNTEGDVNLAADEEYYDVHAVASLFKTYLRELPSTILTRDLHIEFLRVLELDDKRHKILAFNALVHQLPKVNFALLRALSEYLLEVVQNSDRNKMSVKNVCIVFSPTLNIPAPVFAMFLTEFDAIFNQQPHHGHQDEGEEEEVEEDRHDSIRQTLLAPPGGNLQPEVRSPRHQMYSNLPSTPAMNQNSYKRNTSVQQSYQSEQQYQLDPPAEFGMAPAPSSYESRTYVSIPQPAPPQPMYPPPQHPSQQPHQHQTNQQQHQHQNVQQPHHPPGNHQAHHQYQANQQPHQRQQYRMFAPQDAANEKAKRRESAMLLF